MSRTALDSKRWRKKIKEASGNVLICQDVVKFREEGGRYLTLLWASLMRFGKNVVLHRAELKRHQRFQRYIDDEIST